MSEKEREAVEKAIREIAVDYDHYLRLRKIFGIQETS